MKLKFARKYLSIEDFSSVELPDFTVLTGVNGAGKSHLLKAIKEKSVILDDINNPKIVYFNYENFKLENEAIYNGHQITNEKNDAWNFFSREVQPTVKSLRVSIIGSTRPFYFEVQRLKIS